MKNKLNDLTKFISSSLAFTRYLENLGEANELQNDYYDINYIKMMTISFQLFLFQEQICNKNNLGINKSNFETYMRLITVKKGNKWIIDKEEFDNPYDIFLLIRNKLAHGDYEIINDSIKIHNNSDIYINIDELFMFVDQISSYWKLSMPTSENTRYILLEKLSSPTTIKRNIKLDKVLPQIEILEIKNHSKFPYSRLFESSSFIEQGIESIKLNIREPKKMHLIIKNLKEQMQKNNIELEVNRYRVNTLPKEKLDKLKKYYNDNKNYIENFAYNYQIEMLIYFIQRLLTDKEQKMELLSSCKENNELLKILKMEPNLKLYEVYAKNPRDAIYLDLNYINHLAANYILDFYTVYQFGLDTVYKDDTGDRLIDIINNSKVNFAYLDLGKINPTINDIEHPSTCYNEQYEKVKRENITLKEKIDDKKKQLENMKKRGINTDKLDNIINELETEYKKRLKIESKMKQFLVLFYDDYVRNREIITHIRNSIAHGNVYVDFFSGHFNRTDCNIIFKDIFENKLTFELKVKMSDFVSLFSEHNLDILYSFINNKILEEDKKLTK